MRRGFTRAAIVWGLLIVGLLWIAGSMFQRSSRPEEIAVSELLTRVKANKIERATILESDQLIEAELRGGGRVHSKFLIEQGDEIAIEFDKNGVSYEVDPQHQSIFVAILSTVLPFLLIVVLFMFFMNQAQGGGSRVMNFGKAKARMVTKETPKVGFSDVAGLQEAVEEIREIKDYLANPSRFQAIGAKIPKGVLLFGPPGTGKTLLARAVAGEAGVPFFSISGSDFVEMFVGVGAARVRDLFEQAKAAAPAIIFVDEIDAVGRHRGAGLGGGHDEREQTLNQLLVEMDGFDVKTGVVLIAATNRPDILDPALLRPGRFDRQIVVDRPDLKGREEILNVHGKGKPLGADVDTEIIARRTPGFTGADLANTFNEAALLTARAGRKEIAMADVEEAIDRVMAGPERRSRLITTEEKRIIAFHEAGHAVVAHLMPHAHAVHKISIIPRGRALGYTLTLPTEDRYLVTKSELQDEMAVMLGGRAAEELVFGDVTTGAQDDIDRVTKMARSMVCEYGMSELGPQSLGSRSENVFLGRDMHTTPDYSDNVAAQIDAEIGNLIDGAMQRSKQLLIDNRSTLDRLSEMLIQKETVSVAELEEIFEGRVKVVGERGVLLERLAAAEAGTQESIDDPEAVKRRNRQPNPKPGLSPA